MSKCRMYGMPSKHITKGAYQSGHKSSDWRVRGVVPTRRGSVGAGAGGVKASAGTGQNKPDSGSGK
nr:MAG TPA: hypothetical protein [Bacteriophage sp.]